MKKPYLITEIDMTEAGSGCFVCMGDLSGNGRLDFLAAQPDSGFDDRYFPHQIQALTAYDVHGNILWKKGEPVQGTKCAGSDIPVQIADIDGDGYNEVLCVMNKKFCILDGKTGSLKRSFDLPDEYAHDCIIVCNLTGGEYASDVILKNRYHQMWAMDKDFNLLWTHKGNIGHFPYVYDFDGDGADEVMAGYTMLDSDGTYMWECQELDDHCDALWVGDILGNGDVQMVIGGSVTVMYDTKGNELFRYTGSKESQHVALGRYKPGSDEVYISGLDRVVRGGENAEDALFLLDKTGKEIAREKRDTKGWLTILHTINNFFGDHQDYMLAYRRGGGVMPGLYGFDLKPVLTFDHEGFDGDCYLSFADIFDEGREDVVINSGGRLYIYSSHEVDINKQPSGQPLKQPKRLAHQTVYFGAEMPR